jgi:hypothetical protein
VRIDSRARSAAAGVGNFLPERSQSLSADPKPWLVALERYVRQVTRREGVSLWSVLHFVVGPLLPVVGADLPAFERSLAALGRMFVVREDSRLEGQSLEGCAEFRVPVEIGLATQSEPCVEEAGVAKVDLRCRHQPLAEILEQ